MFVRPEYQVIKRRLEEPRLFLQVISGPRQVGKSTLIEQVLSNISLPYNSYSVDAELNVSQAWISSVGRCTKRNGLPQGARAYPCD